MKATTFREWFLKYDKGFGILIRNKDPETQGKMICARYNFNFEEIKDKYENFGKEKGDEFLLNKLNDLKNE